MISFREWLVGGWGDNNEGEGTTIGTANFAAPAIISFS